MPLNELTPFEKAMNELDKVMDENIKLRYKLRQLESELYNLKQRLAQANQQPFKTNYPT